MWLTLEVAGCGDIEPMSDPIAPQSFGLSLAPARNNDNHCTHSLQIYTSCRYVLSSPLILYIKAARVISAPCKFSI